MARPPAPCGTFSAYKRHKRKGEPVDADCRRAMQAEVAKRSAKATDSEQSATVTLLPAALELDEQLRLDARKELMENMQLVKAAMQKVSESDPLKIVTLSKRHSELLNELRSLSSTSVSGGEPEEADPFEQFFGAGGASRRPTAAPRKPS